MTGPYDSEMFHDEQDVQEQTDDAAQNHGLTDDEREQFLRDVVTDDDFDMGAGEIETHTPVLTNRDKVAMMGSLVISFLLILVGVEEHNALTFAVGLSGALGVGAIVAVKYHDARGDA